MIFPSQGALIIKQHTHYVPLSYYCPLDTILLGLMDLCSDRRTSVTAGLKGQRAKQKISFKFIPQHFSGASELEVRPVKTALRVHHYLVAVLAHVLVAWLILLPKSQIQRIMPTDGLSPRVHLSSPDIWGRLRVRKP